MRKRVSEVGSRRSLSGQAATEFGMAVVPLMLMMTGTIFFGLGVYSYNFVAQSARDATRYASVHGSSSSSPATSDSIRSFVIAEAKDITSSQLTVTTNWWNKSGDSVASGSSAGPGGKVKVTVTYTLQPFYPVKTALSLSSSSQMVISY